MVDARPAPAPYRKFSLYTPKGAMSDWKLAYEKFIDTVAAVPSAHADKGIRKYPRFPVSCAEGFQVQFGEEDAQVYDISAGGMGLYSNHLTPDGGRIALTVNKALRIHAEVVYCAPKGDWGPNNPPQHRMGLKFLSKDDGYRVAMLALDAQDSLRPRLSA